MPLELCAAARDRLWATAESDVLKRDSPRSWVGPLPESEHGSFGPADGGNNRSEFRWQWRAGGGEEVMHDLLPRACLGMAEQLLGAGTLRELRPKGEEPTAEELAPVLAGKQPGQEIGTKCRGIYCTLPYGDRPRFPNANSCHTDGHPMSL